MSLMTIASTRPASTSSIIAKNPGRAKQVPDLQVNDVTLCIHGVFTKSDIHILIVDFQKVPEFDIYTLALLLKKVSLPLFCLAFGPESTFLFSLLVTLPVFIIDL